MRQKIISIFYAFLAACFYAVNMPVSKTLLQTVPPTMLAAFLYLGAGLGVGGMYLLRKDKKQEENLTKKDLPYTVGMIALDIFAPIALMFGLARTTSANASLLNNFEIAATSVIALVIFKETISKRLWLAIFLVTLSSALLSFEDISSLRFSYGSLLVLLAAVCWGLENNCTRKISSKNTYEIVTLKGIGSGLGSLVIAFFLGEKFPGAKHIVFALALGFVAYGLSIFFYIKAQSFLGAAKTSAYYAVAPFIGAFLSFVFLREALSPSYALALLLMVAGTILIAADTLLTSHAHLHTHTIVHTHDGVTHTHVITHSHPHSHLREESEHTHHHAIDKIAP
ncbi:MAG: EamA family transporter [Oscillospiraceae bacterium]|nr:EamA family transporter [Oscillospiraceae bacterium]